MRAHLLMLGAATLGAVVTVPMVASSGKAPGVAAAATVPVPDDTAALARLLTVVRGAPPLFCELTTRMIDGRNYWNTGGRGGLVEVDAASSELIRWVHLPHDDPRFVPRLSAALRDPDGCVRRVAGGMLGRVRHASARAALVSALDDASAGTREVAALGLGLQEDSSGVAPLIARLRDPSADVRRTAAWALGVIEHNSAMMPLVELLGRDPDPRVREAAAWAIGEVTGG